MNLKNTLILIACISAIVVSVTKLSMFLHKYNTPPPNVPMSPQELRRATLLKKYQALEGALLSHDPKVRDAAIDEVKKLDIKDVRAIVYNLLTKIWWQSPYNSRIRRVLSKIGGPAVDEAILERIEALKKNKHPRWEIALLLVQLSPTAKTSTPTLAELVLQGHTQDREDARYTLAQMESISDKAAFGIDLDTVAYTVQFPMNTEADIGKQYWVYLGAGNVVTGVLKSKTRGAHPCSTEYHGVYTYGFLSIPEEDQKRFAAYARQIALVSDLKPVTSPISKYMFVEPNYVPPTGVIQKINAIIDSHVQPYTTDKVVDKKIVFGRYGIGKDIELLRVNIEYSLWGERAILASFDFIVSAGEVKFARDVYEPSVVGRNGNPGERVHFSINDFGFYDNVFDFDSNGIVDLAENVSGYEGCGTRLYEIVNLSSTPVFIPILEFSGGL